MSKTLVLPKFKVPVPNAGTWPYSWDANDWQGTPVRQDKLATYPLLWSKESIQRAFPVGLFGAVSVWGEPTIKYGTVGSVVKKPKVLILTGTGTGSLFYGGLMTACLADLNAAGVSVYDWRFAGSELIVPVPITSVAPYDASRSLYSPTPAQFTGGTVYHVNFGRTAVGDFIQYSDVLAPGDGAPFTVAEVAKIAPCVSRFDKYGCAVVQSGTTAFADAREPIVKANMTAQVPNISANSTFLFAKDMTVPMFVGLVEPLVRNFFNI